MSTPNLDSRYITPSGVDAKIATQATTDAGQYMSNPGTVLVSLAQYGAKGDAVILNDGAVSASSTAFTSSSAAFTSLDVGKAILIYSGVDTTTPLRTTIAAYVSSHSVTLAASPSFTVSGTRTVYGTDDTAAITSAYNAAVSQGKICQLVTGHSYIVGPLTLAGDNGTLQGYGATLLSSVWANDNVICVQQYGNNVASIGYKIAMALPYLTMQAGFSNYDSLRIGGQTAGSVYKIGCRVVDVKVDGGAGLNAYRTSNVIISGCNVQNSHGNSIGSVDGKANIQIIGNYCYNGNDDLIAVTSDSGNGASTIGVSIVGNVVDTGDAGGIKIVGADNVSVTGNTVRNTYTASIQAGSAAYSLQPTHRVTISGNMLVNGGQCYGTINGIVRYHSTGSTNAYGVFIDHNSDGTYPKDVIVSNNDVINAANRAVQISYSSGLTISGNRIITAGSNGISVGNNSDSTYALATDVMINDNIIIGVQGAIIAGSITGLRISGNTIRSYSNGGGTGYRGITYGYTKNVRISDNHVTNDDGGGAQVFEYPAGTNSNVTEFGNSAPFINGNLITPAVNIFRFGGAGLFFFSGTTPPVGYYTAGTRGMRTDSAAGGSADITCSTTGVYTSIAWAASTAVTVGTVVYSGTNTYVCTTAGTTGSSAISGAGSSITDGGAVWAYVATLAVFASPAAPSVSGVVLQRTKSGSYIQPVFTTKGTVQPASGRIFTYPIALTASVTASTLNVKVTTVGSSDCTGYVGIWADDGTINPTGSPLASAMITTAFASTGIISSTVNASLAAGTYWLYFVVVSGTTMPTLTSIGSQVMGLPGASDPGSSTSALYASGQAAAPTTPPGLGVYNSNAPLVTLGI